VTVPARNQVLAPFLFDHAGHARGCRARQCAQRIAVEVDHARREQKFVAQRRQRIGAVERLEGFALHLQDFIEKNYIVRVQGPTFGTPERFAISDQTLGAIAIYEHSRRTPHEPHGATTLR
jgi:hypothetical protein